MSSLRIWAGVWKPLSDQSGWVNRNIRTIMMGLSSQVSCCPVSVIIFLKGRYNLHHIMLLWRIVVSRLFMDSKIMPHALQEVCRTILNSGFSGRNADYFVSERSCGSWNFSAGPGHLEASGIMASMYSWEHPGLMRKTGTVPRSPILCKVLPFPDVPI